MSQEEIYNERRRDYSAWHRRGSTRRFVGIESAQLLAMIDLDASLYVEYDNGTKEPIALIETAQDVGQPYKTATVTAKLAQRAKLPCFCVLYTLSAEPNPADSTWRDIESFRVRRLWPNPQSGWEILSPDEWAKKLLSMRGWSTRKLDAEFIAQAKSVISQEVAA